MKFFIGSLRLERRLVEFFSNGLNLKTTMEGKPRIEKVIVPARPPKEAEALFRRWVEENKDLREKLGPNDLVVDLIRGRDGKELRRYRIFVLAD